MIRNLLILPDGTEVFSGVPGQAAIQSVTVTTRVNPETELTPGGVCAAMVEATVIAPAGLPLKAGDEVSLFTVDDDGTRQKVGLFTTEKPTRPSANTMSITAYDRVSWLDKDLSAWLAGLHAWPYTVYDLAEKVCAACGLTLANDTLPNGGFLIQQFSGEGITGRQLMGWIGQVAGRFCRATAEGLIEFAWYTATGAKIEPSGDNFYYQNSLAYEDYAVYPVEKVQIQLAEDDVGVVYPNVSGELNTYVITGNYLLTTSTTENLLPIAQHLYETLRDVVYTPCKVSALNHQGIRAGDIIQITDANGKTITTYVMTSTQTGQKVTLESTGSYRRDSSTVVHSQGYKALFGKMLQVRQGVEGFKVTASEIKGNALYDTVEEFYLSASPVVLSGGSWSTQQPRWTADKYIWRRYKVTRGDGRVSYTPSEAGMCINNISVGGRNLIRNSTNLQNEDYYFTSGNAFKKTASGEVVTISDASAEEHDLAVSVSGADDPTAVTVYRYGKNLFDMSVLAKNTPWQNCSLVEAFDSTSNSIVLKGNSSTASYAGAWSGGVFNIYSVESLARYKGGAVTISADVTLLEQGSSFNQICIYIENPGSGTIATTKPTVELNKKQRVTLTSPASFGTETRVYFALSSNTFKFENIMLSYSADPEYEAYVEPQTATPNADGTVVGLTSLYPNMTILTDMSGTTLGVTYKRVAALEATSGTSPFGKNEEFAMFTIGELPESFVLPNIKAIGEEYTLSLWLKSDSAGSVTIHDTSFATSAEWSKQALTFTADSTDLSFMFDRIGTYHIYHPQLEAGNRATDWDLAPEDVEEIFAAALDQVRSASEKNFADLTVQSDGIMAEVAKTQENIDGIREQITTMEQTATGLSLLIKEIQDGGVSKVTTETGYTFGADGLHISGAEGMENVLDEKGMVVSRSDEVVLQANEAGVMATDVKVRNYLIVGTHARFEDYTDGSDSKRTACFFIDGG